MKARLERDDACALWRYPDGSVAHTDEQLFRIKLFDSKWRSNHELGKIDVNKMVSEFELLCRQMRT